MREVVRGCYGLPQRPSKHSVVLFGWMDGWLAGWFQVVGGLDWLEFEPPCSWVIHSESPIQTASWELMAKSVSFYLVDFFHDANSDP